MNVAQHPIGIYSHVVKMKALLNLDQESGVRIVVIYGIGGIGKTTIANVVYNEICVVFQRSSFISNLKEKSEKRGLAHLQEQLLNDILKTNKKIDNVDRGIIQIKESLNGKRVLVILDDVDDEKQLQALVGNFQLFGSGSRIIVTTRDERILTQLEVNKTKTSIFLKYKVEELNNWESLQLFSYHAFGMASPTDDYKELLISAVEYAKGLPLALKVLGYSLYGRSVFEWKSELEKLQRIPHEDIQKILELSIESLNRNAKMIFLDIACFFIGMDKEYAIRILHGRCGFFPNNDLCRLVERSLVTIDLQNKLRMHDLIRDMGREIVLKKSPNDLGKLSRLWFHEDALNVLKQRKVRDICNYMYIYIYIYIYIDMCTYIYRCMIYVLCRYT
jgi:dephospho-CoA kinase